MKKIDTTKYQIQVNSSKLEMLTKKYEITDWNIQFNFSVSLLPNTANWKNKTIIMRPLNIWSRFLPGFPSQERLAKSLAHEVRHSLQKPPNTGLSKNISRLFKYIYLNDPREIEARKWADEHWEEFFDIIKINKKIINSK